jgi:putative DNA primase/helicase
VPEEVRKRFIQVRNKYYFPDGARAFTDRGKRLTTPSENTEVVRSLVAIAKAREWNEITVRGTERFRKEAWLAGRMAGLEVRGYQPSEIEQAHLVRTLARRNSMAAGESTDVPADRSARGVEPQSRSPERQKGVLTGKLIDHGRATYQHDPRAPMSYFVKIETPRGDRVIWGVDLERAFKESLSKPDIGDEVGLRAVRQEAVKVKAAQRDADGNVVGERDLDTHRNRWIIEKRGFFESRAGAARIVRDATVDPKQAVKQHPELVGTYLQVHAAELASKRFRDPQDRERFVARVRSALADSVARGEPLPAVRLRERAAERAPQAREREAAPAR